MVVLEVNNEEIKLNQEIILTSHMLGLEKDDNTPVLQVYPEEAKNEGGGVWVKNLTKNDTFLLKRVIHRFTFATIKTQFENEICCRFDLMSGDVNSVVVTISKGQVDVNSHSSEPLLFYMELAPGGKVKLQLLDVLLKRGQEEHLLRVTDDEMVIYEILPWTLWEDEED